jgi:hypothetical protein
VAVYGELILMFMLDILGIKIWFMLDWPGLGVDILNVCDLLPMIDTTL